MRRHPVDAYAHAVMRGAVPAGRYHRLACQRHLRDRAREATRAFPYRCDAWRADNFVRFAAKLRHYKGEWAGRPITLEPWQLFCLGSLFAWVHVTTGLRRYRTSYSEIPRKNGKSLTGALVALYATFFDGEPGAEGYTIATKREQAKIVFNDCKRLVQSSGAAVAHCGLDRESASGGDGVEARAARRRQGLDRRPESEPDHRRRIPRAEDARADRRDGNGDRRAR